MQSKSARAAARIVARITARLAGKPFYVGQRVRIKTGPAITLTGAVTKVLFDRVEIRLDNDPGNVRCPFNWVEPE